MNTLKALRQRNHAFMETKCGLCGKPRIGDTLLGGSGGVVNSLDFYPASLKSLCCFYFRCVLSSQWKAVTVNANFTLPTLKAFLEDRSQNVSGNKQ